MEEPLRSSAQRGEHNFINLVVDVLKTTRFRVEFHARRAGGADVEGRSLSHMVSPPNDRGLVFRRVYHYPFWQIEALAQRWHWDVARATFDPVAASPDAQRFYRFWQKRLFGDLPENSSRDGFVYVPLQGHLDRQRAFQSCSPLEMVQHCLTHDPDRRVVAALHPNEKYTFAELGKLEQLAKTNPRLRIETGNMEQLLQTCDYVVTENSGVAFSGYFFGKPALLFAKIDFHHIAQTADMDDLAQSFAKAARLAPAYDKYAWWFWQDQSINAGRDDAKDKIAARLRRFGWPIE